LAQSLGSRVRIQDANLLLWLLLLLLWLLLRLLRLLLQVQYHHSKW
jgi:hypothetical protein